MNVPFVLVREKNKDVRLSNKRVSETFTPPIRITDCGHNYCEDCLVKHADGQKTWICPLSRKEHHRSVNSLPRNYLIEQLVEAMTTPPRQPASNPANHSQAPKVESCTIHNRPNELCKCLEINSGAKSRSCLIWYFSDCLAHSKDQCYECCHKKLCAGIEKMGCDVIAKDELETMIKNETKLIKSHAKDKVSIISLG